MNVQQMRVEIQKHYGIKTSFAQKVGKMPDSQVQAIYLRLKKNGVLK